MANKEANFHRILNRNKRMKGKEALAPYYLATPKFALVFFKANR